MDCKKSKSLRPLNSQRCLQQVGPRKKFQNHSEIRCFLGFQILLSETRSKKISRNSVSAFESRSLESDVARQAVYFNSLQTTGRDNTNVDRKSVDFLSRLFNLSPDVRPQRFVKHCSPNCRILSRAWAADDYLQWTFQPFVHASESLVQKIQHSDVFKVQRLVCTVPRGAGQG